MFVTTGGKTQYVVACCSSSSTSGYSIPPLVIFDRRILHVHEIDADVIVEEVNIKLGVQQIIINSL